MVVVAKPYEVLSVPVWFSPKLDNYSRGDSGHVGQAEMFGAPWTCQCNPLNCMREDDPIEPQNGQNSEGEGEEGEDEELEAGEEEDKIVGNAKILLQLTGWDWPGQCFYSIESGHLNQKQFDKTKFLFQC